MTEYSAQFKSALEVTDIYFLQRLREDTQKDESPGERREIGSREKQRAKIESRSDDPRQMAEYQIALELEMWKQQQEELFTAQVS